MSIASSTSTGGSLYQTPALTTRGMKEAEMQRVGGWILTVLGNPEDDGTINSVRGEIAEFAKNYPVPGIG